MNQGTSDVAATLRDHPGSETIDLRQFCSKEQFRFSLHEPFSAGQFTYATDGIVALRVARRSGIDEAKDSKLPKALDEWMTVLETAAFQAVSIVVPQDQEAETKVRCEMCEGRGKEHECPDCDCACDNCGGTGSENFVGRISVNAFGRIFRLKYLQQILRLPGIEVDPSGEVTKPILFSFDGGVGLLRPCSRKLERHIDL